MDSPEPGKLYRTPGESVGQDDTLRIELLPQVSPAPVVKKAEVAEESTPASPQIPTIDEREARQLIDLGHARLVRGPLAQSPLFARARLSPDSGVDSPHDCGAKLCLVPTDDWQFQVFAGPDAVAFLVPPEEEGAAPSSLLERRRRYPKVALSRVKVNRAFPESRIELWKRLLEFYFPPNPKPTAWDSPRNRAAMERDARRLIDDLERTPFGQGLVDKYGGKVRLKFDPGKMDKKPGLAKISVAKNPGEETFIYFGSELLEWASGYNPSKGIYREGSARGEWFRNVVFHEMQHPEFEKTPYHNQVKAMVKAYLDGLPDDQKVFVDGLTWDEIYMLFYYPIEEVYAESMELYEIERRLQEIQTADARADLEALRDDIREQRVVMIQRMQMVFDPEISAELLKGLIGMDENLANDPDLIFFEAYERAFVRGGPLFENDGRLKDGKRLKNGERIKLQRYRHDVYRLILPKLQPPPDYVPIRFKLRPLPNLQPTPNYDMRMRT